MPDIQGMQLELISEKNVKLTKSYHQEGFQTKNRKSSSTEFCEIFGENSFFSSEVKNTIKSCEITVTLRISKWTNFLNDLHTFDCS